MCVLSDVFESILNQISNAFNKVDRALPKSQGENDMLMP